MIQPNIEATIPELAAEFQTRAKERTLKVIGNPNRGLVAYPKTWDKRVMLCAHLDTVKCAPGYDDRAGVAVMFDLMDSHTTRFAYAVFMDEETGASGSREIVLPQLPHVFVGLDRRGTDQVAFYDDESLDDWKNWVLRNDGVPVNGSVTDCTHLGRRYGRYCFNFSVGFLNEHTSYETFNPEGAEFARRMALRV